MSDQLIGIVWNPSKTDRKALEEALQAAMHDTGLHPEVTWAETEADDPGYGAAREVVEAGAEVVIAAGGDGTVRAVAEFLAEHPDGADLAIAPLGTGNLLARNLEVPINDLAAAFERALTAKPTTIDAGWAELELQGDTKRFAFAVMAGFGIDAHMITETNDDLKARAGWLAYVESLGRALSASEVIDIRISVDGAAPVDTDAHTFLVGNCGTLQGGITLLPDADPSDGELDLLLLNADGIGGWLDTMRNMVWDNGLKRVFSGAENSAESSDSVTHRRARRVVIELDEPRVFEVDGDEIGETTRIEITTQPGALRVR